jgi:hypothetical protein
MFKYNYILAAALDVGTALGIVMLFLCTTLPGKSIDWAGNNIWMKSRSRWL